MKPKSHNENEFSEKKPTVNFSRTLSKKKEKKVSTKKTGVSMNDNDDGVVEVKDDWEKADDEDYDPDFEEFDFTKSKIKKSSAKKEKSGEDFDLDEDFRDLDLFNDGADADDEEDDFI